MSLISRGSPARECRSFSASVLGATCPYRRSCGAAGAPPLRKIGFTPTAHRRTSTCSRLRVGKFTRSFRKSQTKERRSIAHLRLIESSDKPFRLIFEPSSMLQGCFTETAVKVLDPDTKGSLDKRIDALAKVGKLPEAVGKWAHEVRFVVNEAAHEHDEPTRESIDAVGE